MHTIADNSGRVEREDWVELYIARSENSRKPVEIEGVKIIMELHTGSAVSIVSENKYRELFCHLQLEKKTTVKLHNYMSKVNYKYYEEKLPLYVIKGSGSTLFGRVWPSIMCIWKQKSRKVLRMSWLNTQLCFQIN